MITIKPNKYYLYYHVNPETEDIFYVGVGKHSRVLETSKCKRSKAWVDQFNKTGLKLFIVKEFDNSKDAYKAEIEAIKKLREEGIKLLNVSGGGKGGQRGVKPWNAGKKNVFKKESLKKISKAGKRRYSDRENREKHAISCGSKKFIAINLETNNIEWSGYSQKMCAEELGLRQCGVNSVLRGRTKTHKGYTFKYEEK